MYLYLCTHHLAKDSREVVDDIWRWDVGNRERKEMARERERERERRSKRESDLYLHTGLLGNNGLTVAETSEEKVRRRKGEREREREGGGEKERARAKEREEKERKRFVPAHGPPCR